MAINECGLSAAESNRASLRFVKEDPNCWGRTPDDSGTKSRELRMTSSSISAAKETQTSNEIRADRMIPSIIEVGATAEGEIEGEFSAGTYDEFIEAFLLGTWSKPMTLDFFKGESVSFVANNQVQVPDDVTGYFSVGQIVKTEGFSNPGNNGYKAVTAVAFASGVTTITFTETNGVVESGNAYSKILDANDVILRSTAIRLGTAGASTIDSNGGNAFASAVAAKTLVVGQRIYIDGLGYESATVTLTAQATDAETLTLFDGEKTVVVEFDSNSAFTRGREAVTIGADADATATALALAVNGLYAEKKTSIYAKVDTAGPDPVVTFVNTRPAQGGSVSDTMAALTVVAFAGGAAANHGFFTITSVANDVIGVKPNPGTNANAGAVSVTVKGSHVRNPGVLTDIVKRSFTIETGFTDVGQYMISRGQRIGGLGMSASSGEIVGVTPLEDFLP